MPCALGWLWESRKDLKKIIQTVGKKVSIRVTIGSMEKLLLTLIAGIFGYALGLAAHPLKP